MPSGWIIFIKMLFLFLFSRKLELNISSVTQLIDPSGSNHRHEITLIDPTRTNVHIITDPMVSIKLFEKQIRLFGRRIVVPCTVNKHSR